jgi:hypothetical protein
MLTVERVVSVYFPLKCREICSRRRLFVGVVLIVVVYGALNVYLTFSSELGESGYCGIIERYEAFHMSGWYWIDSSLYAFVPFAVIFTGNVLIARRLLSAERRRATMAGKNEKAKTSSLTPMLMSVSWCFLLLNLPSCIFFIGLGRNLWPSKTNKEQANLLFAYTIVNLLYYVNNAINFFLYCLTGTKFRRVLWALVCRACCLRRRGDDRIMQTSFTDVPATRINDTPV